MVIKMIAEFKVTGMHCNSCLSLIKMSVQELEGIADVSGDQDKGIVKVVFDEKTASVKDIVKKVEQEGYKVVKQATRK
jgi:copper chaperone CopZ